jgi:2',3'-cyclic-nucleotide 2'-phosphodiesterase (5'-nucleotidase family)
VALAVAVIAAASSAAEPGRAAPPAKKAIVISIVGTNDLHGHVEALPPLGGYLANLRRARARDGGAVLLLDAGDMFQGTLESNLGEGGAVIRAYNALGYAAAAIGNHEFDFGPAGDAATPRSPADDARGALKARAAEARFPLLAANLVDAATRRPVSWPNVRPSAMVERAGIKVGLIGVTTMTTPRTVLAANFRGLAVTSLAPAIAEQARALRAAGAMVVVVAAHAGGGCVRNDDPDDVSSCDAAGEIAQVARALPPGAVDAIVAGHTHDGIAHRIAGIAIIESFAEGRSFGRIDLTVDGAAGRAVDARVVARILPPHPICATSDACAAEVYEGAPVLPDEAVAAAIAPDLERARARRDQTLGVTVASPVTREYRRESALGNLFADLMRAAHPEADVAITNGGGLRADLPAGALTYGALFRANPFDNRFAVLRLSGGELEQVLRTNLGRGGGIVSVSGVRVEARCEGKGRLTLILQREPGARPIRPSDQLTIVTSDFLATGGDGLFSEEVKRRARLDDDAPPIRDAMAAVLTARGGTLDGADLRLADPSHPRLAYPGDRPVRCGGGGARVDPNRAP